MRVITTFVIILFLVNIQSPTTPGVGSTDPMQTGTLTPTSISASAQPPVMTTMGPSQVPPRNGDDQNNTAGE